MAKFSDRAREPVAIPLPEPPSEGRPIGAFQEPYSSILERQKIQSKAAFESRRRKDRVERIKAIQGLRNSKVVVYYSVDTLTGDHAEILFDLLETVRKQTRLDLFLLSPGGFADPAFKMAALCRDFAEDSFAVIIPHYAKSAATLLCLGSDELVMGSPSEIGPIDPRIEIRDEYGQSINVSATSVEEALDVIEERTAGDPSKSVKYIPLIERINLNTLGESRRALSSSKQYAEVLLRTGKLLEDKERVDAAAQQLATGYYSHNYPIKSDAAETELHFNVTRADGNLWEAIWQLHKLYKTLLEDSRNSTSMITTVFEAEEFFLPIRRSLVLSKEPNGDEQ